MEIKELTNKEFKAFTNSFSLSSLYQTPEYGFVMSEEKNDALFLGLVDNNAIKAATLLLITKKGPFKYAYAPRGFLIDYNNFDLLKEFTSQIKKYLSKLNVVAIKINPIILRDNPHYDEIFNNLVKLKYRHLGYNDFFEGIKPRYEAIIDLNEPYYHLFSNIKKEFRTKIRSAEKLGIKIYKSNELEYLYKHTNKKYPRELKYYKNICEFFGSKAEFYYAKLDTLKYLKQASDNVIKQEKVCLTQTSKKDFLSIKIENDKLLGKYKETLIGANKLAARYPEGIILASCLIVKHGNEAYLLMDGYNKQFKKFNAKHILIWKLIERYTNEGYSIFNLGGIPNPLKHSSKYDGLKEFKLSFNVHIREYIGDFELVTNKPLYLMYKK